MSDFFKDMLSRFWFLRGRRGIPNAPLRASLTPIGAPIPSDALDDVWQPFAVVPHVVIVSEDLVRRKLLNVICSRLQAECHIFAEPHAALAHLVSGIPVHMVIADSKLTGMTGFDLCRHLRKSMDEHECGCMLLAELYSAGEILEAFASGANDIVPANYAEIELLCRMRRLIRGAIEFRQIQKAVTKYRDVNAVIMEMTLCPDRVMVLQRAVLAIMTRMVRAPSVRAELSIAERISGSNYRLVLKTYEVIVSSGFECLWRLQEESETRLTEADLKNEGGGIWAFSEHALGLCASFADRRRAFITLRTPELSHPSDDDAQFLNLLGDATGTVLASRDLFEALQPQK